MEPIKVGRDGQARRPHGRQPSQHELRLPHAPEACLTLEVEPVGKRQFGRIRQQQHRRGIAAIGASRWRAAAARGRPHRSEMSRPCCEMPRQRRAHRDRRAAASDSSAKPSPSHKRSYTPAASFNEGTSSISSTCHPASASPSSGVEHGGFDLLDDRQATRDADTSRRQAAPRDLASGAGTHQGSRGSRLIRRWEAPRCWSGPIHQEEVWTRSSQRKLARSDIHTSTSALREQPSFRNPSFLEETAQAHLRGEAPAQNVLQPVFDYDSCATGGTR
jgi:hypothetical protein